MASGTSPTFSVSDANLQQPSFHNLYDPKLPKGMVNPPTIDSKNYSIAITKFIQPWQGINFRKIAPPLYDDYASYTGLPTNVPDLVADWHFIGVMMSIDYLNHPVLQAFINATMDPSGPA